MANNAPQSKGPLDDPESLIIRGGQEDLSDPEHVRLRDKKVKAREDARVNGMRTLMKTPEGRAWMRHLLDEKCHVDADLFTGNSTTFYNAALRELGTKIRNELKHYCFDDFVQMLREGRSTQGATT